MTTDYRESVRNRLDNTLRLAAPRLYARDRKHIVDALMLTVLDQGTANEVWLAAKQAREADNGEVPGQTVFDMTPPQARHLRAIPGGGEPA